MIENGVAAWSAIGGSQPVGRAEWLWQAGPVAHLGVIGQALIGLGDGLGELKVGHLGALRPDQCMVVRHGLAVNERLGNVPALGEFGFDPFRVDVAPEAGDELVLLSAFQVQIAVGIELAQIARRPPDVGGRRFAQITQHWNVADQHLAIISQANMNMRQRFAHAADTLRIGRFSATTDAHSDKP